MGAAADQHSKLEREDIRSAPDAYSLEDPVQDGYLVPPRVVDVPLKFVRTGTRYDELSEEERAAWDETEWNDEGEIPDEVGAGEINRRLFTADTVDKVLQVLMERGHRVEGGDRIAKTIVFAANAEHAAFVKERFDANWPALGEAAKVITHSTECAQALIDDFTEPGRRPDIAISVDMLDTGIDVPEVASLVLFKPVHSKAKFWQMIGRGTRLRPHLYGPGQDKRDFYVLDVCGNFEWFRENPEESGGNTTPSLTERLFRHRLQLQLALLTGDDTVAARIRDTLQQVAAALLTRTGLAAVKQQAELLEPVAADTWWKSDGATAVERIRRRLRGLLRYVPRGHAHVVYSDFEDELGHVREIEAPRADVGTDMERFTAKAREFLRERQDDMTLQKVRRNRQLTTVDLQHLDALLQMSGTGSPAEIEEASEGGLGLFIRQLLGLDREAAQEALSEFLDGSRCSAAQIRFVQMLVEHLTANGVVEPRELFDSPFTDHGDPTAHFEEAEVHELMDRLREVEARARVPDEAEAVPGA